MSLLPWLRRLGLFNLQVKNWQNSDIVLFQSGKTKENFKIKKEKAHGENALGKFRNIISLS